MAYHKDKQQAFQAAEQDTIQAIESYQSVKWDGSQLGKELKHLRQEVQEAYEQIQNALETASETQRKQLTKYEEDVYTIMNSIDEG
ncbi:hypothetical protein [Ectobacillus polymachus]|uniref:hypothetical protein n=1 Tax=Ectobacillus polymachus TaxID=1508806 RepID=UPI003A8BC3CE